MFSVQMRCPENLYTWNDSILSYGTKMHERLMETSWKKDILKHLLFTVCNICVCVLGKHGD